MNVIRIKRELIEELIIFFRKPNIITETVNVFKHHKSVKQRKILQALQIFISAVIMKLDIDEYPSFFVSLYAMYFFDQGSIYFLFSQIITISQID